MEHFHKQLEVGPVGNELAEMKDYVLERAEAQLASHETDIAFGYKVILSVSFVMIAIVL